MHSRFHCILALLACTFPAHADIVGQVNTLRAKGCEGHPGVRDKLKPSRELDRVAREWSKGGRLRAAIDRLNYHSTSSASMRVKGAANDKQIVDTLGTAYCDSVTSKTFTDIGVHRTPEQIWIVLAAPYSLPSIRDARAVSEEVLQRVNDARAKPRKCGSRSFERVPPLTLSAVLSQAALKHAQDMATKNFFEHEGSDGSTPSERVERVGYKWRAVAENIAAGANSAEQVVNGWLSSPGHCANIMGAAYTQMGIAFAINAKNSHIYWAQDFATPR